VQQHAEDGQEDVEQPHGDFDQVKEHAYYADDKVVLCVAGEVSAVSISRRGVQVKGMGASDTPDLLNLFGARQGNTYNPLQTSGILTGR
jgi:hypothetical protein